MFLFALHGHIVKLEMASNFTRISRNQNVAPDSVVAVVVRWYSAAPC